jgi:prevent-host-death family protein
MPERVSREITQRELRNEAATIMRGVERGESFTITRNGTPIGRLVPLRKRTFVPREEVLAQLVGGLFQAHHFQEPSDPRVLGGARRVVRGAGTQDTGRRYRPAGGAISIGRWRAGRLRPPEVDWLPSFNLITTICRSSRIVQPSTGLLSR